MKKLWQLVVVESWTNRLYRMLEIIYVNKKEKIKHTILSILKRGIVIKKQSLDY